MNTRNSEISENWRAGWWVNTSQSRVILMIQASAPQRMLLLQMQDLISLKDITLLFTAVCFLEPMCLWGSHSLASAFGVVCCYDSSWLRKADKDCSDIRKCVLGK